MQEAVNYGVRAEIKSDSQPGISELVEVEVAEGNVLQFYNAITAPSPGFKKTNWDCAPSVGSRGDNLI